MSTPNNVLVDPEYKQPDRSERVDLGGGLSAPLGEVMDASNPSCRYCSLGIQTYHEGDKKKFRLCGCGVAAVRRRMQGDAVTPPVGRVVVTGTAAEESAKRRLAQLEAALAKAEEEARTVAAFATEELARAEDEAVEAKDLVGRMVVGLQTRREDLDHVRSVLVEREKALADAEELHDSCVANQGRANLKLRTLYEQRDALKEKAKPFEHRAKRLRDRIALHKQKHPEAAK